MLILNQWFLTGGALAPRWASINFQGSASPYTAYDMQSLIIEFAKDNYLREAW